MDSNIYPMKPEDANDTESVRKVLACLAASLEIRQRQGACDSTLRTILLERVLDAIPPPGTRTIRAGSVAWMELTPGVTISLLRVDPARDNMTAYIRMLPGAVYAAHHHTQTEECLVIEGEIFIGSHRLCAGDMHVASGGTRHAMITSPRGGLLLVRCQCC